jgi:hypothetical protein
MSDESPGVNRARWAPADGPDPGYQDVLTELAGRIDRTRPIGPLALRMRSRRPYVLTAVAVAALLSGAGAALVVTDSPHAVPAHNAAAPGPAPASSSAPSPADIGTAIPGLLHGQFIVRASGGYQTVDVQTGLVTAVTGTSITLRSSDGFTGSYTVVAGATIVDSGHAGIGSVKVGDQASLQATVTGSIARAARIDDLTLLRQHGASA